MWGTGLLVVGVLGWAGGGGWRGGQPPQLRELSRLRACLRASFLQVAQRGSGTGRRHSRPFQPLPSLTSLSPASQSAISHLLHTRCVHRAPKASLTVLTVITTASPLAALADRDPNSSAPGSILRAQKPLLKPGMWNLDIWEKYHGKPEETGRGEGWERASQFRRALWSLTAARRIKVRGEEELPVSRQLYSFPEAEILRRYRKGSEGKGTHRRRSSPLERWDSARRGGSGEGETE